MMHFEIEQISDPLSIIQAHISINSSECDGAPARRLPNDIRRLR